MSIRRSRDQSWSLKLHRRFVAGSKAPKNAMGTGGCRLKLVVIEQGTKNSFARAKWRGSALCDAVYSASHARAGVAQNTTYNYSMAQTHEQSPPGLQVAPDVLSGGTELTLRSKALVYQSILDCYSTEEHRALMRVIFKSLPPASKAQKVVKIRFKRWRNRSTTMTLPIAGHPIVRKGSHSLPFPHCPH